MPIYKKFGLIKIDDARIDETCSAYFKWKDLNTYIKSNSNRGINMPDAISEPMGCYCLDLVWNRGNNAIYQWRRKYVRKNKSGVVPTLTANQGEGGHNVCLIKSKFGIRKMTPHECFNTQGFPKDFKLPNNQSDARLYKQAGNSVCVSVINRIAQEIVKSINNE